MTLSDYVHTFGKAMLHRYGERVHKIAIDAGFTCPNRHGIKKYPARTRMVFREVAGT